MLLAQKNMGKLDQLFRVTLGIVLIYIGFVDQSIIGDPLFAYAVGAFGVINLGSGFIRVCPIYLLAGINTDKEK